MKGLNQVTLCGTLGRDPETRVTKDGQTITRLNVATGRWDKREGKELTDWHRVVTFGKTAEFCARYMKKGSKVLVSNARIEYGSYENDGVKVYTTDIVSFDVQSLDGRPQSDKPKEHTTAGGGNYQDPDDSIPF